MEFLFIKQYPFILSFLMGLIPALIWLWFWLKEDRHPESAKNLTLSFLGGMLAVILVLPTQKLLCDYFSGGECNPSYFSSQENLVFTIFAAVEELFKFGLVYFIALRQKFTDEPVDDMIYLIVGALGFVTLENTMFLLEPIRNGDIISTIINSNLRFLGASLVHIMSSATIGICMGLSFYKEKAIKLEYTIFGIILAIILHTGFNLFIINQVDGNIFFIFGMVWVGIVIVLLLFEKVKNITYKYER